MNHEERIKKFHTPDEDLDPETLALRERHAAVQRERRERGEFVAESLAQRHLNDIPLPPEGSPADLKARAAREAREQGQQ